MRLGAWDCVLEPGSLAAQAYGTTEISERHRHRYEFNREYEAVLTGAGLRLTGTTPDATYVEIVELPRRSTPGFSAASSTRSSSPSRWSRIRCSRDFVGASYKNGLSMKHPLLHEEPTPHEAVPAAKA